MIEQLPPPPPGKTGWPWTEQSPRLPQRMPDGSEWPRISVVTPSYNQGRFIEETIRSVLLQNYPNTEYIIMDGGSTDESVEIITKYTPWLTSWVSEKDSGQSQAINNGFSGSTGDILCWINSDDFFLKSCFEFVAEHLSKENPSWLIGSSEILDLKKGRYIRTTSKVDLGTFIFWINRWVPQQSIFWNRNLWNHIPNGLNENLHYVMDVDLFYRMFQTTPPIITDQSLAVYRYHDNAKTISGRTNSDTELSQWYLDLFQSNQNSKEVLIEFFTMLIHELTRLNRAQSNLDRLSRHPLGKLVRLWRRLVNPRLDIFD